MESCSQIGIDLFSIDAYRFKPHRCSVLSHLCRLWITDMFLYFFVETIYSEVMILVLMNCISGGICLQGSEVVIEP